MQQSLWGLGLVVDELVRTLFFESGFTFDIPSPTGFFFVSFWYGPYAIIKS
jgi:hypothetical protein